MSKTRGEVMPKIEGHRKAIREHIKKYYDYPYPEDKEFALKTIRRCQQEIETLKSQCNVPIESSSEDTWNP